MNVPQFKKKQSSEKQYYLGGTVLLMQYFWFLGNQARELIQTKCKLSEI